jgi:hypothetical protein
MGQHDRSRRIIPIIVISIVVYVVFVMVMAELRVYAIKTTSKLACREYMVALSRATPNHPASEKWKTKFLGRIRSKGVAVQEDDYSFEIVSDVCDRRRGCACEYEVLYDITEPWPILSNMFTELKPWRRTGVKTGRLELLTQY